MTTPVIDRLFAKVAWPSDISACWVWTAMLNVSGYGAIRVGSKLDGSTRMVHAHRVSYELAVGPIPDGKEIDHLCRNRACINPMHLEAVTKKVNTLRGESFSAMNAAKTHCDRGHRFDDANTYVWRGWRMCRACRSERRQHA